VGQKTHPTGFRTGVNKSHNALWFANYGAYSEVLKEDYKIRKFFEKNLRQAIVKQELLNSKFKERLISLN
jgi:small subunit ribosomal protein S3